MDPTLAAPCHTKFAALARAIGFGGVLVGGLVVVGWIFDLAWLKSISPNWVAMKINTATCFILTGLALALQADEPVGKWRHRCAQAAAIIVLLFSLLTLLEYALHQSLGIDQLLMLQPLVEGITYPGRMSPAASGSFLLLGVALLTLDWETPRGHRPAQGLALITSLVGLFAMAGYIYGAASLYELSPFSTMAAHTSLLFFGLSQGVLLARSASGPWSLLTSASTGGAMVRRLLPFAIVIPLVLGWLRLQGEQRGFYGSAFGLSLDATLNVFCFTLLVWLTARWLNRVDLRRQRVEAQARQLAAIVEFSDDAIVGKDLQGIVTSWNASAERIFGYPAREMIGQPIMRLIPPERQPEETEILRCIQRGESVRHFETMRVKKDGQLVDISVTVSPIRDDQGRIVGASKVARDITERKKIEQEIRELNTSLERRVFERTAQLEAANKELEAFSYSVSHDLRAPLRAVDGFSQAVEEDYGTLLPDEGRRYLRTIRDGAQRMGALIDDLLAFSRLSRQPLNKQPVDNGRLVRNVLEELRPQFEGRKIDLRLGDLPACQGDAALLKQAWANLLSNAVKYTRKRDPAVIEIGCAREQNEYVFYVRDNGTGFDMQYAHKLFGVFQRLHRAEEYEGTGVGLAIVQRIIHRHGGRVWADAALNRGATFFFTLEGES